MKKILSGILSGAFVAAVVAIPSLAQMTKKSVSPSAVPEKSAVAKAKQIQDNSSLRFLTQVKHSKSTLDVKKYLSKNEVNVSTAAVTLPSQLDGDEEITRLFVATSEGEDPGTIVPPYTSDYAANGLEGWTILDNNNDGYTWTVNNNEVRVHWNNEMGMDDYLITPAIQLESGKAYNLKFTARANGSTFAERIEVLFGKEPTADGLTQTIVEPTDLTSPTARQFSVMLTPSETGLYYVGFHGISDADKYYLNLGNISISAGVSALAPGAATDLVVTPDANGALKANVSFKAPATTMNGETLSDNMTKVEVLRTGNVVKTFDNVAPGEACSFENSLSVGGNVTYTVVGYNSYGQGIEASATAFVGFSKPADMGTLKMVNGSVPGQAVLSWDAVTTDVNGLTYPAGAVTYKVCEYNDEDELVTVAENITDTSYTFQAVEAGKQEFIERAVFPVYQGMQGKGSLTFEPIGTPYNGIEESFPGKSLNYIWGLSKVDGGTLYLMGDTDLEGMTSQDSDGGYLGIYGEYPGQGVRFFSGLVSLAQIENPALSFYTYNIKGDEPDGNEITVYVKEEGQEEWTPVMGPKTVDTLCDGQNGWSRVSVSLSEYAGKTIQFNIEGVTVVYMFTMLDNIRVGTDLSVVSEVVGEEVAIQAVGNDIVVLNAEGLEVTVASVDGAVVYNGLGDAKTVVTVEKGVYVVTAGKNVKKVLVK